jgi:hypothetical protein
MKSHLFGGLLVAGILAVPVAAQMQDGYLDVFVAKVKLGKRGEFDTINKRMVDLNRRNKGDNWLAYEAVYGQPNTVYFVSQRTGYSAAEAGTKAFFGALTEGLGKPGMQKLFDSFDATVESERAEFRRRRWDLSASVPADTAAYTQLVGQARYLRSVTVRLREGKALDFESQLKRNKSANERANPGVPMLVSQSAAGEPLGVFHITTLVNSMGDLDNIKPLSAVLGDSYGRYLQFAAESVAGTEIMIGRFLPEISNPPEEIAAVDTKFWRPAPPAAAPAKRPRLRNSLKRIAPFQASLSLVHHAMVTSSSLTNLRFSPRRHQNAPFSFR